MIFVSKLLIIISLLKFDVTVIEFKLVLLGINKTVNADTSLIEVILFTLKIKPFLTKDLNSTMLLFFNLILVSGVTRISFKSYSVSGSIQSLKFGADTFLGNIKFVLNCALTLPKLFSLKKVFINDCELTVAN